MSYGYDRDRRDRSRSRERGDRRGHHRDDRHSGAERGGYGYGRGGGHGRGGRDHGGGRGYGGRGGRGNGGRGGRGGRAPVPRPERMMVKTNYFKMEFLPEHQEWIQYRVEIIKGMKEKAKAPQGSSDIFLKNDDGTLKIIPRIFREGEARSLDLEESSPTSRRVLKKWAQELWDNKGIRVVQDGSATAYSVKKFFQPENAESQTFPVRVRKGCDEDEDGADRVFIEWFLIKLTNVCKLYPTEGTHLEAIRQAMDIIMRSALMTLQMTAFGRSPRVFHFPRANQAELIAGGAQLEKLLHTQRNYLPLLGIIQAVRFCENGNMFMNFDTIIDYANREFLPPNTVETTRKVQLLNERSREICGVAIGDLHRPITNPNTRKNVEKALKAIFINVEYKSNKPFDPEYIRKKKEQGWSDADIERKKVAVRRNKKMKVDNKQKSTGYDKCIVWDPEDPAQYSFIENTQGRTEGDVTGPRVTVPQYFLSKYGIKLRFPRMPLVHVGVGEWYPIEFLFQAFGKMRDANDTVQKNAVLDFYDRFKGFDRVSNISQAFQRLSRFGIGLDALTTEFNFRIYTEPIEVEARVLKQPKLNFANQSASINNGSWNLRNVQFQKPADLASFAIVDLSGGRALDFVRTFCRVARSHGMQVPVDIDLSQLLPQTPHRDIGNIDDIQRAVNDAIARAKDYFLHHPHRSLIQAQARKSGSDYISPCFVIRNTYSSELKTHAIVLPMDEKPVSHRVIYNGETRDARMQFRCISDGKFYDPFDFDWTKGEVDIGYEFEDGNSVPSSHCQNIQPMITLNELDIIFDPSIVICVLPEDKAEKYGIVKFLCQFQHGVQSQCIVAPKYDSQRSKEQYCSNVALKVNAKLSNGLNQARGWTTSPENGSLPEGISWIGETETLVMGISLSNSLGYGDDCVSVITASAALDNGCMQFAQEVCMCSKTEVIASSILRFLVKKLMFQVVQRRKKRIQRFLVYRDGVSEGSFPRVRSVEVKSIRDGYHDYVREYEPSCEPYDTGCLSNGPLITFVACMSRNNIKIVPSNRRDGVKQNVFSGTCVDNTVVDNTVIDDTIAENMANLQVCDRDMELKMEQKGYVYSEPDGSGYDFLLTPHGGGLGTSKPVQFRIILNENAVFRPNSDCSPLTKELLEQATYEMSFQYSTATKAVRLVPVVCYSARCSETVLKYINHLNKYLEKTTLDGTGLEPNRGRDGVEKPRFVYFRKEFLNADPPVYSILHRNFSCPTSRTHLSA